MASIKYYFLGEDDEYCYPLPYWYEYAQENGLDEIELIEAIPDKMLGIFWCKHFSSFGDNEDNICGTSCLGYNPKNGKTGICKHKLTTLFGQGKKVKFKIIHYE